MDIYILYNNKEMDSKYRIKCFNKWFVYDFKKNNEFLGILMVYCLRIEFLNL